MKYLSVVGMVIGVAWFTEGVVFLAREMDNLVHWLARLVS